MSTVRQISISIKRGTGQISEVTDILGEAGVNIRGFSVCDSKETCVLHLIVDSPDTARQVLVNNDIVFSEKDVICLRLDDRPGSLALALTTVSNAGVRFDCVYSLILPYVVFDVEDSISALTLLKNQPVHIVTQLEIASI